jgi:inner membrane protein
VDPFTHTLVGAGLARTRLGRLGALPRGLAAATLIVGANLPDVDVACYFEGADFALAHRRGWTHGVLAMAVLPLLLAGAALALRGPQRWRRGAPAGATGPPVRFAPLLALAAVAVWSHPLLDWLNTYGVRLLAPFDWTWFYGDAVYIVDPWIWLALGGPLFLARSASRRALLAWGALGFLATLAVLGLAPEPARWVWLAGLALLVALRWAGATPGSRAAAERLATAALVAVALYVGLLVASGSAGRALVLGSLAGPTEQPVQDLMVGPEAADPFHCQVVVETPEGYRLGRLAWLERPRLALGPRILPKPELTPVVRAALEAPSVWGFVTWMRYPTIEVERAGAGYTVHLIDLRYARRRTSGFGTARVELGPDLAPVPGES